MNFFENESPEKLRGGYYTSQDIARFLVRWVEEIAPKTILEPSCGDGAFIRAMAASPPTSLRKITACEIVATEAAKAREEAHAFPASVDTRVWEEDFLRWTLLRLNSPPIFDAVVGNPPFIRYQYLNKTLQDRAETLFRKFRLPFTRHTNAWVPFIIASLAMLRPAGRLAMVVPAELLHVLHAQSLRSYLLQTCSRILVLDPAELLFADTLQGVVLLLAEKAPLGKRDRASVAINHVRGRSFLDEPARQQFTEASFVSADQLGPKWLSAFLTRNERQLLEELRARRWVRPFGEVGTVAVGIVTGANKFFLVPDATVHQFSLGDFAHPMFGRSEHVPGVLYDDRTHQENRRRGYPTNFLWFRDTGKSELPRGARLYIDNGEAQDLHTRYKCRIRTPWYSVPSVFATPVGMLKRSHDFPRLVLNSVGAFTTDTAYRIAPANGMSAEQLVFAFVNSLTALSAELEGRHYGGGVLELVPSEINRVLLPYLPNAPPECDRLDAMFRAHEHPGAILRKQDARVLNSLGLDTADRDTLLNAWMRLRSRRQRIAA